MFGRRLVILVAVLMGLTALAASLAPPPQTARRDASPTPTPSPSPTPARPAAAAPRVVTGRIEIGPAGSRLARGRARAGDTVMLEVSGDVVDAVTVDDLPVIEPIAPDSPAQLQISTDAAGSFPVRLLDQRREIGVLEVAPGP
jgi:hypothetical protein